MDAGVGLTRTSPDLSCPLSCPPNPNDALDANLSLSATPSSHLALAGSFRLDSLTACSSLPQEHQHDFTVNIQEDSLDSCNLDVSYELSLGSDTTSSSVKFCLEVEALLALSDLPTSGNFNSQSSSSPHSSITSPTIRHVTGLGLVKVDNSPFSSLGLLSSLHPCTGTQDEPGVVSRELLEELEQVWVGPKKRPPRDLSAAGTISSDMKRVQTAMERRASVVVSKALWR
ncbi:unnamed protein product [Mycena citricolor]|nr:unnamed protein product [Mycena citricolor]